MLVTTSRETTYAPTREDMAWLYRAVEAEGEPRELVAQTLVNGFLWARETLGSKRTLAEWVRAYSQPVNPRWMAGGDLYESELAKASTEQEREDVREKSRRRAQHASRTTFSAGTMRAVQEALQGRGPRIPSATDFAAHYVARPAPWVALTPVKKGLNRLWMRPGAAGWQGYTTDAAPPRTGAVWWLAGAVATYWLFRGGGRRLLK